MAGRWPRGSLVPLRGQAEALVHSPAQAVPHSSLTEEKRKERKKGGRKICIRAAGGWGQMQNDPRSWSFQEDSVPALQGERGRHRPADLTCELQNKPKVTPGFLGGPYRGPSPVWAPEILPSSDTCHRPGAERRAGCGSRQAPTAWARDHRLPAVRPGGFTSHL